MQRCHGHPIRTESLDSHFRGNDGESGGRKGVRLLFERHGSGAMEQRVLRRGT